MPDACYDEYSDRGESENRNKEFKCGLKADRLSDHRYFANLFRLYLHATAYNLLIRMRNEVVDPPPEPVDLGIGQASRPGEDARHALAHRGPMVELEPQVRGLGIAGVGLGLVLDDEES